ncbi:hypothetical protein [Halodesulfovibrio sp.]|jgi:hypothetical protein|uniref:hypothetical protein n=1 Tax=Halodesulfovibrio sp. TaxID=1912772 RepID=UPI0025F36222|nr:hypothetical protein [Halodesulfovibrio sp.]MCT4628033.1 hypothetical protein [Halodesulfovibrio sp.]
MSEPIPSEEQLGCVKDFFLEYLLSHFQLAAEAACEAFSVDKYFGNYSFGAICWENHFNRFREIKEKGLKPANHIQISNKDLMFHVHGISFRCHKVGIDFIPRGGNKAKKAAYAQPAFVLPGLEDEFDFRCGSIIIGLQISEEWGLEKAVLGRLVPATGKKGKNAVDFVPFKTLFTREPVTVPELPTLDIDTAQSVSNTSAEIKTRLRLSKKATKEVAPEKKDSV